MTFADLPLAEQRGAAWRDLPWPCRYCNEPNSRRCVTSTGARTTPHGARMADVTAWMAGRESRQGEVDSLTGRLLDIAATVEATDAALARMTTQRDDANAALSAAHREITGLTEQVGILELDLAGTEAEYAAHMRTHEPPKPQMLVGAAVGGNSDPGPLEAALGRPLAIRRTYYGHAATERTKALTTVGNDHKMGRIPYISFKAPRPWAEMAAGAGDAWALDIGTKLAETRKPVRIVIHHEPEGDGDIAQWVAMQRRILPLLASEHVLAGVCYTGWHELNSAAYAFDKVWPGDMAQFLSVDIYQRYGTTDAGLKWTPLDNYFGRVAAFAESVGVPWGLGETGVTDEAFAADPDCLDDLFATARKHGAEHLAYFNSALNSKGSWPLTGAKLAAFVNQASA